MTFDLELKIVKKVNGDEDIYLNFWNSLKGQDVVCKIVDNKLYLVDFDQDEPEITLKDFIDKIRENYEHIKI